MSLEFTKMHGLGNDFVILDGMSQPMDPGADLVRHLADRRRGVGCDQVLLVEPGRDGADFGYRVFNADGSEAGHCGNGIRCVARLVRDRGWTEHDRITFSLAESRVETVLLDDGRVAVDMGAPRFDPRALPFEADDPGRDPQELEIDGEAVRFGVVSLGNPHAVIEVDDVCDAPVATLGPQLESHPAFPERVNVGFMAIVAPDHVRLRVWERGAGETPACGTGACAAVAVGRRRGRLADSVRVALAGGELVIDWAGGDNPLWMTGPAETVFRGTLVQ